MSMILIFDLDDTLYPERSYVDSGFRAVAARLFERYEWDAATSLATMNELLETEGRGAVFDRLLAGRGVDRRAVVGECLRVYRSHLPDLTLYPAADRMLGRLQMRPYVVTDGHKMVQQLKVRALSLEPRCSKVFITHRYGTRHAKPSTYCFDRIRNREGCRWEDMVYVGDNPAKDFVNLTPLGLRTIRVLTGEHRLAKARPGFEAQHVIDDLTCLPDVIPELDWDAGAVVRRSDEIKITGAGARAEP
jgi:putative hydrolase of the HAD superfamily